MRSRVKFHISFTSVLAEDVSDLKMREGIDVSNYFNEFNTMQLVVNTQNQVLEP